MLSMKRGRESSALLALCVLVLPLTAQDPVGFPESPLLAPPIGESLRVRCPFGDRVCPRG